MPYLTVKNIRLFYNERGKGVPLVILHSNGGASKMLKAEIRHYSKYFRVLAFDLPGHGRSDRIHDFEGDFWQYSAFLIKKALVNINITDVNVMGTNGGAIIGIHLAQDDDLNVMAVIADSFEGLAITPDRARSFIKERERTTRLHFFRMFFNYLHGKDWADVLASDSRHILHFAEYKMAWFDSLEETNVPVLLTVLASDNMIPRALEKMKLVHDFLPNSTLEIFDKGKHPAMLSNKRKYRKLVRKFLQ
ncbi:MAG: alpha/beta hydrolase [Salinivirgaceae bacterium]|jgi:pimeloyl-ACP methyl ester carboxylesterase|nr:alpha/beta hydrolase [Salinivirgaceae bacterium]